MYDKNDLHSFALCVWREARGEGILGMQAVGHVIKNRVGAAGFPATLHDVIYQKNAFTSMSVASDPEYNLQPKFGDSQFAYIEGMAPAILNGSDADPTLGARYYADLKYVTSGWFLNNIVNSPAWHKHTTKIGRHDFYL